MAVQSLERFPSLSPGELRHRLDVAGFEMERLDRLSADLKIDLVALLAGWAPILAEIMVPYRVPARRSWWRRFLEWRKACLSG